MDYPKTPGCVLTPQEGIARYLHELRMPYANDERIAVEPTMFATLYFERGAEPDVRQRILECFDAFEGRFGSHLKGGLVLGGKYTRKTTAGIAAMRRLILEAEQDDAVEFVRSSVTDQYTAPAYTLEALTNRSYPGFGDGGMLSYIKFTLPWDLATDEAGLAQYHDYLRFLCAALPVRGGYGGLLPSLPFDFDRYMPLEYELARRFTGLEIDTFAYGEKKTYCIQSIEGEEPNIVGYGYLKPGAKITGIGHIKGVNWITVLGDVFVDRLGGEAMLRRRFAQQPEIELTHLGQCLLIQAGPFPRLGAPEEGLIAPYAAVNREVRSLRNPEHGGLHTYMEKAEGANKANARAWLARFDLPEDGPVVPWAPGDVPPAPAPAPTLSAMPGEPCPRTGLWFAPHLQMKEVRLSQGEPMPGEERGTPGGVVWYWRVD